jgi:hypothetical protein
MQPQRTRRPNEGATNKVMREVGSIEADYRSAAVGRLAVLGGLILKSQLKTEEEPASSGATQVVACSHLLNRAYGFPSQPVRHSADESFETLLDRLDRRLLRQPEPVAVIELQSTTDGSFEVLDKSPRDTPSDASQGAQEAGPEPEPTTTTAQKDGQEGAPTGMKDNPGG